MGNSLGGEEYNLTLENNATIDMVKEDDESDDDGGYSQGWTMSYTICDSTCTLYLEKYVDEHDKINEVFLELEDDICFGGGIHLWIKRVQSDFIHFSYKGDKSFQDVTTFKFKETFNSHGCIMTWVFCYGRGGKGGLIVVEGKKRSKEAKHLYETTVAHYYAISRGNMFTQNKIDIGLSMVVNFNVSNGSMNYTVKGPDRHPSAALFYMFEQVCRSGNWKLTACPHCAIEGQGQSSEIKHKDDIHKNILPTNMDGLQLSNSTSTKVGKSTKFVQDVTTHTINKINQSQPSPSHQQSRAQSHMTVRNPNVPPRVPNHGLRENKRLELIDNHEINGNGNGNRIGGDQKFKFSIPFYFVKNPRV